MKVSQLADMVEQMAAMDFEELPKAKFISELVSTLVHAYKIDFGLSTRIALRMTINLSEFDYNDPEWKRVVNGYAIMVNKLYVMYGHNVVEAASQLSIDFNN
jgi:hypothetical protein